MSDSKSLDKLIYVRQKLIKESPFYGVLSLSLNLVEREDLPFPTMGTDGKSLYFHPKFIEENDVEIIKSAIKHELLHIVFGDCTKRRMKMRDHSKWNKASDHLINLQIVEEGRPIKSDWLCNAKYKGYITEEVYDDLPDEEPPGCGGVIILDDLSEEEAAKFQDKWDSKVATAAYAAKEAGKLPAGMEKFVKDLLSSKEDWRSRLQRFASAVASGKDDYTYLPPGRRSAVYGTIWPSMRGKKVTLCGIFDTSGSMGPDQMKAGLSELNEILNGPIDCKLRLMSIDTIVHQDFMVEKGDTVEELNLTGGGGTSFDEAFQKIEEDRMTLEGERVDAIVVFTDGYVTWPSESPGIPTLAVLVAGEREVPEWIEKIVM